jgi:hypothetical protein
MTNPTGTLALARHGVLMAATLATLTACQSSALPQSRPLLANTSEKSASVQKEQTQCPKAAVASAPAAGASAPQAAVSEQAAASRHYAVRWLHPLQGRDKNDGVEVIDHGWWHSVQLVVTSQSGAGEVDIQPTDTFWPRQVQVQFQYASGQPFDQLERLFLQVDPDAWPGDLKTDLDSFDTINNFVVWRRDCTLRVDLPAGWLHDRQTLHMAWADRLAPTLVLPRPPKTPSTE